MGKFAQPTYGWALSSREVAIPAAELRVDRLPGLSVKSGRVVLSSTRVTFRPRLIIRRGAFWTVVAVWDLAGLLVLLVLLPATFLLHPYARWLARMLPEEWHADGVLPVTAAEAKRISLVQRSAMAATLGAILLLAGLLAGLPDAVARVAGSTLALVTLIAVVLGASDYYSLPDGGLVRIQGERFVLLRGVHPKFVAAFDAMRPADAGLPAAIKRVGEKRSRLFVIGGVAIFLAFIVGSLLVNSIRSSQVESQWIQNGPCTVQLRAHEMNATAEGSDALVTCKAWLHGGNAESPSGVQQCSYARDGLMITVRDTGGARYGWAYCTHLTSWSTSGGLVPDIESDSLIPVIPLDSPSPTNP